MLPRRHSTGSSSPTWWSVASSAPSWPASAGVTSSGRRCPPARHGNTLTHFSGVPAPTPRTYQQPRGLRYVRRVDATVRARLVEDHLGLSRRAATMIFPRVRQHVEFDELVALGNAGLAEAATRYDASRGTSFATF